MGVARQFEQLDPFHHVACFRSFVVLDLSKQLHLLFAPFMGHAGMEVGIDHSIQLIEVDSTQSFLELCVLLLKPPDRFLMFPPAIIIADFKRSAQPFQNRFVEGQKTEMLNEDVREPFFLHIN
ncbi:hypothetical protein GRZ55_06685 [Chelativorans sp. ZYF759]|uniref:hypothetical protein n=1 Tax=Chelativorans sp. ZYF759 TaxID=2692213 RepID=UPI00145C3F3A|nr:hypothetical protein [Chelativorans sp. ZYF759]NMG38928.1 hypothetical protein [Chelativorans sp. ZYF759]